MFGYRAFNNKPRLTIRIINLFSRKKENHCFKFQKKLLTTCSKRAQDINKQILPAGSTHIEGYLKVPSVATSVKNDVLTITLADGSSLDYPVIWLRDNCQCINCFEPISFSRIINAQTFSHDAKILTAKVEGDNVSVTWADGHESVFTQQWLYDHSFDRSHQEQRAAKRHPTKIPWTADEFLGTPACKTFSFNELINDDAQLFLYLKALATYGVAHISGTPPASGQAERIAQRIAFVRKTHYGKEFHVKDTDNANNVAYKAGPLQLHTDLPYYHYMPGVNILHCIVQSSAGGESVLTDGLSVSQQLPIRSYRTLADIVVDWVDVGSHEGQKFHTIHRAPVLCEDSFGNIERINWSQPQRDSNFTVSISRAIEWYKAVEIFCQLLHSSKNAVVLKLQPGDILTFDNTRILHGRTAYSDGRRHLIGAYVDWDEIYSRLRVLQKIYENA